MKPAPCPTCPRLSDCLAHHDDACADLRAWREAEAKSDACDCADCRKPHVPRPYDRDAS